MNTVQRNFCRNLKGLRRKFGLSEWQMARILKRSDEAMDALARGEVPEEVDTGARFLIHGYYGIQPWQMLGDDDIFK